MFNTSVQHSLRKSFSQCRHFSSLTNSMKLQKTASQFLLPASSVHQESKLRCLPFTQKFCSITPIATSQSYIKSGFHTTAECQATDSPSKETLRESRDRLLSEMNMRLVNENSFLSWCRNAYLSTVVGVGMFSAATTTLGQGAGAGAFLIGGMNLVWGTGCHIVNLIRLRHVTGMSKFTLFLNLLGSTVHFFIWLFVVVCYIGFLDEIDVLEEGKKSVRKSPIRVALPSPEDVYYESKAPKE